MFSLWRDSLKSELERIEWSPLEEGHPDMMRDFGPLRGSDRISIENDNDNYKDINNEDGT